MSRLDRYLLAQMMAYFGFFALVLVAIYWLNQAVRLFNQLLTDGQTARVVLELTSLSLPLVVSFMLPLAAFATMLFLVNRLIGESELVVMKAAGASPLRLARPVLVFGLVVTLLMSVLEHVLVPMARAQSVAQRAEIANNVASQFLIEGQFQHPAQGVTFFIRDISERGELLDIFLSDRRGAAGSTVFLASKAVVVRSDTGPRLVMFDGMAQTLRTADGRLSMTRFADFSYDLAALINLQAARPQRANEMTTLRLLAGPGDAATHFEIARRVVASLNAPVAALIGFAALMLGGFSRLGMWRQIAFAVMLLIALLFFENSIENVVARAPGRWPLLGVPLLAGAGCAISLLWWSMRPKPRRQAGAGGHTT